MNRKSEFVRTPKFKQMSEKDTFVGNKYLNKKLGFSVIVESILAVYCLLGVLSSIYFMELASIPFQILFTLGFSFIAITSIKHAYAAKKI